MAIVVTLLVFSTVFLAVRAIDGEIHFPLKVLEADLKAIENYKLKFHISSAAVYLPVGDSGYIYALTAFNKEFENEIYLELKGSFQIRDCNMLTSSSIGHLLFKNGVFYFTDAKTPSPKALSQGAFVYHVAHRYKLVFANVQKVVKLSIRYFSLKEIERFIARFYTENQSHLESAISGSPTSFLAVAPESTQQFVEFSLLRRENDETLDVDGKLHVLIGKEKNGIVKLTSSVEASKLVYDPKKQVFSVLDSLGKPVKNVYGIRMASVGFLAESENYRIRLLSSVDLTSDAPNPDQREIPVNEFLIKVRNSEPKHVSRYAPSVDPEKRPKYANLQVMGHILEKSVNFVKQSDVVDETCPLVIVFKINGSHFGYGTHKLEKICTDDSKLWAVFETGQTREFNPDEMLTLKYRELQL